ncbi:type III pantothenate kinase [Collinsella sp. AGMB00827]|uniref:Type III pantothenate kinase n=1 Tax=Collinsella ureilytica TaxID=2869515 RepID=A0ABS7MIC0_9ACTN|nr:type III pantothenate kinase [Collinsella urealyticum]MBY4796840.1 type III pantothenate kinase [Collinsella urealyticum]
MNAQHPGHEAVLAVDVGNTRTDLGLFDQTELLGTVSLTTPSRLTEDEALTSLEIALGRLGVAHLAGAILSCVVPNLTQTWTGALERVSTSKVLTVGPGLKTGLKMNYDDPKEVGSDRVADAVAARELVSGSVVVVDLGTTTNFEVIDSSGVFLGGIIAPGLALGARALERAAARLPMIELTAPKHVIGKNTRSAIQAGVVLGEIARINGLIDAISSELNEDPAIIVTGEGAAAIAATLERDATAEPYLTLTGLAYLWQLNQGRRGERSW